MTLHSPTKVNKTLLSLEIEDMVRHEGLTYLEATALILEENGLEVTNPYIAVSSTILDKIVNEAINSDILRPSTTKKLKSINLEDLF